MQHQFFCPCRLLLLFALTAFVVADDPVRLEGIRATPMPLVSKPVLFDTPEADAILAALKVFPADNAWNQIIADWPLRPDSKQIVASIGNEKPLRYNTDMAFVLVPTNQPLVDVKLGKYAAESDAGPYPVPDTTPIEGWPAYYRRSRKHRAATLDDVQRDTVDLGGDRHAIVVDPMRRKLFEFYTMKKTDDGWQAAQASIFDLATNKLRPDGWTSADAAGLPIFPAVVRYDELKRGRIDHALRFTVTRLRRARHSLCE